MNIQIKPKMISINEHLKSNKAQIIMNSDQNCLQSFIFSEIDPVNKPFVRERKNGELKSI